MTRIRAIPTATISCCIASQHPPPIPGRPMPKVPQPFRGERYEIGTARDGRALALKPMTPAAADKLGAAIAQVGPWAHYATPPATLAENFKLPGIAVASYRIECGDETVGAVAVRPMWLMGPYLQMLAVL